MEKNELNNSTVIKNISTDQSEILQWIMNLYTDGKPFECDITASELKFYGDIRGGKYNIPSTENINGCLSNERGHH